MTFEASALILTWVALLLLSLVVAGLIRQVHALSRGHRPISTGLPAGAIAPELERLTGSSRIPVAMLFLSADCGSCPGILKEARELAVGRSLEVHAIFAGEAIEGYDDDGALSVHEHESRMFDTYGVPATPYGVIVDQAGKVRASEPVGSSEALRKLLAQR